MPANDSTVDATVTKAITKSTMVGAGYRTVALVVFLIIAWFLFYGKTGIVPGIDTSIFFIPLAVGAVILYMSTMAGMLLAGKLARPIMFALIAFAVTVFLSLVFLLEQQWPDFNVLTLPIFLAGTMLAVNELMKAYAELTGMVSRAGVIIAMGFFLQNLLSVFHNPDITQLGFIIFIGSAAAAVFSMLGLFNSNSNPLLSYAGKAFKGIRGVIEVGVLAVLLMSYFIYARPFLVGLASIWLVVVEWLIMCIVIAIIFVRARTYMKSISELRQFGDGHAVAGKIFFHKDDIEMTAAIIEEFVNSGKKEGLVACVAKALVENGSSIEEIRRTLGPFISYTDESEPMLLLKWATGNITEANRRNRLKVAIAVIEAAAIAAKMQSLPAQNKETPAGAGITV